MRAVFITGASGGIGQATVQRFADREWRVFAGVRSERDAERIASGAVTPILVDVTDDESVRRAAEEISRETGSSGLQVVVNNAGLIVNGPLELVGADQLRTQFEVNVYGPVKVIQAMLPMLRKGNGRILNISAPTGRLAIPFMAPIGASKAALESISDALRIELAPWSVPVIVISPAATDTQVFAKADALAAAARAQAAPERSRQYDRQKALIAEANAKQRLNDPMTIARVIVRAAEAKRPKTRYLAGSGARLLDMLAGMPVRVRSALLSSALGLHKAPLP